jgi:hypothetical protein
MKQRHTAWVTIGTNDGQVLPSWFYAFRKWEDAKAFMDAANDTVSWDLFPCEFMSVEETLENFKQCMQEGDRNIPV